MIKKIYTVSTKDYDYFDHFRHNADDGISNYEFESLSKVDELCNELCKKQKEIELLLEKLITED